MPPLLIEQTVPAISQIERLVEGVPGWTPIDQLFSLFTLLLSTAGMRGDVIEIGAWCGRSSVVLGTGARLLGETRVVSIDLFPERSDWEERPDGTFSFAVTLDGRRQIGYREHTVWREPYERDIRPLYERYGGIREIFDRVVSERNLSDTVQAIRGTSDALRPLGEAGLRCRLAFVDADHSYDAVCRDIRNVEGVLLPGGWICFDDAFSHYEGVDRAIRDLVITSGKYVVAQQLTRKLFVARKRPAARERSGGPD